MRMLFAAVVSIMLAGCGLSPAGDALRGEVAQRGAAVYDTGLENSVWFICNAASVGSVNRRFGADPETYLKFCGGADRRVPPREQAQPQ